MNIKSLTMRRSMYGPNEGKMVGDAEFESPTGTIQVTLTPDACQRILSICADSIVDIAQDVAVNLKAEVIEQTNTPQLEEHIQ